MDVVAIAVYFVSFVFFCLLSFSLKCWCAFVISSDFYLCHRLIDSSYPLDKLQRQHGTHRDASYELRTVCLTAIQMALETKRPKFISLALNGMHVSALLFFTQNVCVCVCAISVKTNFSSAA